MNTSTPRIPTEVDAVADDYLASSTALSPIEATYLGIAEGQEDFDDLSPEGYQAHADLVSRTLDALAAATPVDAIDHVTVSALRERLELAQEFRAAGLDEMEINVISSPLQNVRGVFDLMSTESSEDWSVLGRRMAKVPRALDQWVTTLRAAAGRGDVGPRRQVTACINQCSDLVADDGYFAGILKQARAAGLDDEVVADLTSAVGDAAAAYTSLAQTLRHDLLDRAPEADACGAERYALHSRSFLGATVDLAETYQWGQEELARITAEMQEVAGRIRPGASVKEAVRLLDADPAYHLEGTDALRTWMQERADEVIADLAGTHFDIPAPIRTIECMIAPTQSGGIYYTAPSEDFSRPGRMWWAVPKGVTSFGTWRELTTVYHEGVPGHHLQVGQTVFRSELLNRWRRLASWTSGHGEGWALYAERLMSDLGYMDDPGNRMGLLDGQSLRAARVVLDIGVHCGFEAPAEVGGGTWDYDKAWSFLGAHANMEEGFLRYELDRYLGWPGQAPSYKVGERIWMELRDEVAAREGDAFDITAFHRRALDIGGVGLDTLREAVLAQV